MSSAAVADMFTDYLIPGLHTGSSTVGLAVPRRKKERGLFSTWVTYPESVSHPAPRLQQQIQDIEAWTGWSRRRIAWALNTSHPTVSAVLSGSGGSRVIGLGDRTADAHAVVDRLYRALNADAHELSRILTELPFTGGPAAVDCLRSDEPARAYLAALDVMNGPRASALITGSHPIIGGDASVALSQEE